MNDLEKAKLLVTSREYLLPDISRKYHVSYDSLRHYRQHPDWMHRSRWDNIHQLAEIYDKLNS